MNKAKLVHDLLFRIGKVSDDSSVTDKLAAHWISLASAFVLKNYLDNENEDAPQNIKKLLCIGLTLKENCGGGCSIYILDMPYSVQDGCTKVFIDQGHGNMVEVEMVSGPSEMSLLQKSRFSDGSDYWYQIGGDFFLVGKFPKDMKFFVEVLPSDISAYEDAEGVLPDFLALPVMEEAFKIGLQALQIPHDVTNDGKDRVDV